MGEALRQIFAAETNPTTANDLCAVAATMLVVPGGFVDGDMLVEVEVDAYVLEQA